MNTWIQASLLVLVAAIVVAGYAIMPSIVPFRNSESRHSILSDSPDPAELDRLLADTTVPVLVEFHADW